jgi:hypothetical protein
MARRAAPLEPAAADQAGSWYDKDWYRMRALVLVAEPLCRRCAAQLVDHIVPIREDPARRLDPTNLQPVCFPCHRLKTNRYDGGFGRKSKQRGGREFRDSCENWTVQPTFATCEIGKIQSRGCHPPDENLQLLLDCLSTKLDE